MSESTLHALAAEAGIAPQWRDYRDRPQVVDEDTLRRLLTALGLPNASDGDIADSRAQLAAQRDPARWPPVIVSDVHSVVPLPTVAAKLKSIALELEDSATRRLDVRTAEDGRPVLAPVTTPGYHRLRLDDGRAVPLIVAPATSLSLAEVAPGARLYGIAAQLYSLRRSGDGGIGDFGALAEFARAAAGQGADAVAVSPVHALFAASPDRYGPYAPSSRLFVNPLYADPAAVLGADAFAAALRSTKLAEQYAALEALPLIDWPKAARAKWAVLRALWSGQLKRGKDAASEDYLRFVREGGERLREHALFEALHSAQLAIDPSRWNWRSWDAKLRDPKSAAVAEFAKAHADELGFHVFAQWLADCGLRDAQAAAKGAGMKIGLVSDLAVGTDSGGSHGWSRQGDFIAGAAVGAPPDELNTQGQNWGLTAFSPHALREHAYAPFIEMLRASLKHAGGIRIDHVLGLRRLWLAPEGAAPGAYLQFPLDDLLRVVALESHRHRAIVIGEDLGTVPSGFRERMDEAAMLGMRVLFFERQHRYFVEPARWSPKAMAVTSTHDLSTLAGWWQGRDLDWRAKLDLFGKDSSESQERAQREEDRDFLWGALAYAKLVEGKKPADAEPEAMVDASLAFVARTPAPLAMLPVEDVLGLVESPNLPGTLDEHPNWQRRLPGEAAGLLDDTVVKARLKRVRHERGLT